MPGTNLLPVMAGQTDLEDRAVFGASYDRDKVDMKNPEATLLKRWVIHKQYKLILTYDGEGSYAGGGSDRNGRDRLITAPELFDLVKDPYEQTNLYGELPGVAKALQEKLDTWYALKERKVHE